ncbi:universal stress protein [Aeromicrobium sp.]|uniref:universal stress protein n=1 Tax=Aeromicrobium sp. TaxID=1871063 RepID=UPI003C5D4275
MTIAVAYRPDEFGRAALDWAAAEARSRDESLLIINVHRLEPRLDPGHARGRHVQAITDSLAVDKVPFEVRQVEGEDISGTVLFEAEQASATLIVIGVRQRSPVGKALMGSVAQQILLDSPVPVVAVKP